MESATISAIFVSNMLAGLNSRGIDLKQVLVENDIPTNVLENPKSRVTVEQLSKLSLYIIDFFDDLNHGLTNYSQPKSIFKFFCYAAINSPTVGHVLNLSKEFNQSMSGCFDYNLDKQNNSWSYQLIRKADAEFLSTYAIEQSLIIVHRLLCWMTNMRIPVLKVDLDFKPPFNHAEYRHLCYGAPVNFNQPFSAITIPKEAINYQVVRHFSEVNSFLKHMPLNLLSQVIQSDDLPSQIRRFIEQQLQEKKRCPNITAAAVHFNRHPQNLRRELSKYNVTYREIRTQTRLDIAHNLLQTEKSVEDIAYLLDFAEPSTFIRAFKQWTGYPPREYQLQSGS